MDDVLLWRFDHFLNVLFSINVIFTQDNNVKERIFAFTHMGFADSEKRID